MASDPMHPEQPMPGNPAQPATKASPAPSVFEHEPNFEMIAPELRADAAMAQTVRTQAAATQAAASQAAASQAAASQAAASQAAPSPAAQSLTTPTLDPLGSVPVDTFSPERMVRPSGPSPAQAEDESLAAARAHAARSTAQMSSTIRESAQQIWLAGLGAFAKAQKEGNRMFDTLIREGSALQTRVRANPAGSPKPAASETSAVDVAAAVVPATEDGSISVEPVAEPTASAAAAQPLGSERTVAGSEIGHRVGRVAGTMARQASQSWDKLEQGLESRMGRALSRLGVPSASDLQVLVERIDELNRNVSELSRQLDAANASNARGAGRRQSSGPAGPGTGRRVPSPASPAHASVGRAATTRRAQFRTARGSATSAAGSPQVNSPPATRKDDAA